MSTTEARRLDHEHYAKFKDLVLEQTGLSFPKKKRRDLERAVLQGLSESPCRSIGDYFDFLVKNSMNGAMDYLVKHLTVGETYFYRDQDQLELLQNEIFPKLISDRAIKTRKLRVWSAGCATGEEPYSLAIIMRELIPFIDTWDSLVLATDINKESLERAERGRYTNWSFRSMPQSWLEKYFFVSSENEYHLSETIKKSVIFSHLNLKKPSWSSSVNLGSDMDLILCRNVAIYFDEKTINQIMENFYHCLSDGGWLLMGASDPIPPKKLFWTRNYSGVFIYQKKSDNYDSRNQKRRKTQSGRITIEETCLSAKSKRGRIKKPTLDDALAESRALLEVGQPVLAADKLEARLKEEPKSVEALFLMAKAAIARGELRQAKKWALEVISLDKLNVKAYYLLSTIYQGLKDEDKAVDCLKKTVYLDTSFIPGYFSLGCLHKKQKRMVLAEKHFKNVVRLMIGRQKDEIVPETSGTTFGKLLEVAEMNLAQKE